jgi:hypothetical protein
MSDIRDLTWQPFKIVPYGAVLHLPAGWEALPPVPANGPEILRATGGPGRNLIAFKVPARGAVVHRTREYFAVRGNAAFVLGMGSTTWEEHLPLIEQIVGRFELTE